MSGRRLVVPRKPRTWGIIAAIGCIGSGATFIVVSAASHAEQTRAEQSDPSVRMQPVVLAEDTSSHTSDPYDRFLRFPTASQRSFLNWAQTKLARAPFESQMNVNTPALGEEASLRASESAATAASLAAARFTSDTGLAIPHVEDLISEYQQVLAVYLDGSKESLQAYWTQKSLGSMPENCPYNTPALWELSARTLRRARMSTEIAVVRPRYLNGVKVGYQNRLHVSGIADRPGRHPRLDAPEQHQQMIFEVAIGIEARAENGSSFKGILGMWMTYDHEAATPGWVLSRIEIYNRPPNIGIVMPNL